MRALRSFPLAAAALVALLCAALSCGLPAASAAQAAGAPPGVPGCSYIWQPPDSWILQCSSGSGTPGTGGGSGGSKYTCTLTLLSPGQIRFLGLPPPPKGDKWAAITCPGRYPFGGVTLVTGNGAPAVTPQELLQIAIGELRVPTLRPGTAPPLGRDGLVGLPELFWVPGTRWHPVTVTVRAGPVWAESIATPRQLTFYPGGGLPGASCAGPGTAYTARSRHLATAACSYTYGQSSALQVGHAYQASVTVTWRVTWIGSGGTGGVVNAALQVGYPIALRVAEAQALVTSR